MKHIFLAIIAQAMVCGCLCAQTVLNSGFGTTEIEGGYQIEFSIGEMSNVTTINSAKPGMLQQVTQGFLQPQRYLVAKPRAVAPSLYSLSIFPNPATDRLQLQGNWEYKDMVSCTIQNAEGKVVLTQENLQNTATFQISDFSSGVYYLTVAVKGKTETICFVKAN